MQGVLSWPFFLEERMKYFLFGFITALIIGGWIALAIIGVISVKMAITIPVGIIVGIVLTLFLFGLWWNS